MDVSKLPVGARNEYKGTPFNRPNKADELSRKDESNLSRIGKKRAWVNPMDLATT